MRLIRLATAISAAFVLAGCAIGKPIPQATTYVVELPAAMPTAARRPETLRMGNVRVAAAFAGDALVYRMDEVQLYRRSLQRLHRRTCPHAWQPDGRMARPRGTIPVGRPARQRPHGALRPRSDRE